MLKFLLLLLPSLCVSNSRCNQSFSGCATHDEVYAPGDTIELVCVAYRCEYVNDQLKYQWQMAAQYFYCDYCRVSINDGFKTFDGHQYQMNKTCNYTLLQPISCSERLDSYNTGFAVYSEFETCPDTDSTGSCLKNLTFKVNENTILTVNYPISSNIIINGETIVVNTNTNFRAVVPCSKDNKPYPLLVLGDGSGCIYIQGQTIAIQVCSAGVYLWVTPTYKDSVGGLCGFYSGKVQDDFLKRNCQNESLENSETFVETWKTRDQKNKECISQKSCDAQKYLESCKNAVLQTTKNTLPSSFQELEKRIANCVTDCCTSPDTCNNGR